MELEGEKWERKNRIEQLMRAMLREIVIEIVIEIVQIKQNMSVCCIAPLYVDFKSTLIPAGVCGVPLSNNLL